MTTDLTLAAPARDAVGELGASPFLPRVDARHAGTMNRLAAAGAAFLVRAAGVDYLLEWLNGSGDTPATLDRYRFRLGPHTGQLLLDMPTAQALLGERRIELLPRELRYILLADALQDLVVSLEQALSLQFEWQSAAEDGHDSMANDAPGPMAAHAPFVARASDATKNAAVLRGQLAFDDAGALPSLVPQHLPHTAAMRAQAFDRIALPLAFQLGHTSIQLREISSIRPGDIISVEQWRSSGAAIVVTAEVGGRAGIHLTALAEGFRVTVTHSKDSAMKSDPAHFSAAAGGADSAGLPIDRLDALEVTLRFEVGELALSLGELRAIRAGHVFDLEQPLNRSAVRILAHGNLLGKGTLVAVGDRLGVRVSEFAPGED